MPQQTHCNGFPVLDLPKGSPAFFHPQSSLRKKKHGRKFQVPFLFKVHIKMSLWWTHWAVCGSVNGRRQCNWQQRRCTVALASQSTWQGHVCPQIECWCPHVLVLERSHYLNEMRQNMTEYVPKKKSNKWMMYLQLGSRCEGPVHHDQSYPQREESRWYHMEFGP